MYVRFLLSKGKRYLRTIQNIFQCPKCYLHEVNKLPVQRKYPNHLIPL